MDKKAKILLIDDDVDFVETTKLILESKPYDVVVAYNGVEGLQKAREENPDLILLDVIMPVEDGFTAAKKLKSDRQLQDIPVIMLTSFSQRVGETNLSVREGMDLETEDYIAKPVPPQELLQKVEKALQR